MKTLKEKILAAVKRSKKGLTVEDIFLKVQGGEKNFGYKSVEGRVSELAATGDIYRSAKTRKLSTGRQGSLLFPYPA